MFLRSAFSSTSPHMRSIHSGWGAIVSLNAQWVITAPPRPGILRTAGIDLVARKMTTITVGSPPVQVTLPAGLTEEKLLAFAPFNNWLSTLARSLSLQAARPSHPFHADPYALRSVAIQSYDLFGASRLGFLKLTADVSNAAGERLPGSVFLRGPSVAMLIMLIPDDDDDDDVPTPGASREKNALEEGEEERYVLLTSQPRIPASSLSFAELPAGMVDDSDPSSSSSEAVFAGAAAREIQEELGLSIPTSQLVCLNSLAAPSSADSEDLPQATYPSAGGCDEHVVIYAHERRVPRAQLREWAGREGGLRGSGERITLRVVPMRELWREGARDAKCLAAVALWEGLRREGKV